MRKEINETDNFNGLVNKTKVWGKGLDGKTRDQRSKFVMRDKNPLVVLFQSGEMSVSFTGKSLSKHSTTGKVHVIRVTFFPEKHKKESIASFAALQAKLNKLDKSQPLPKDIISRTDLRNMKCKVHCTCPDYTYRMEYANTKRGNSNITTSNGAPPIITNPSEKPGLCKHILRLIQWLGGGAPISGKVSLDEL